MQRWMPMRATREFFPKYGTKKFPAIMFKFRSVLFGSRMMDYQYQVICIRIFMGTQMMLMLRNADDR
jgi:hypothetical protein